MRFGQRQLLSEAESSDKRGHAATDFHLGVHAQR
jgi:hypothetical protein